MARYVALLRGVNVGGHHRVPMAELREVVTSLGYRDVETVLQSGNVVFSGADEAASAIEARLAEEARSRFGFAIDFFVRTRGEWEALTSANPFLEAAESSPSRFIVTFLKHAPAGETVAAVRNAIIGPERLACVGRELFTLYPDGIGRSTLHKCPEWAQLAGAGTARNWNTVGRIKALLGQVSSGRADGQP